jgi:hypothetical protein
VDEEPHNAGARHQHRVVFLLISGDVFYRHSVGTATIFTVIHGARILRL